MTRTPMKNAGEVQVSQTMAASDFLMASVDGLARQVGPSGVLEWLDVDAVSPRRFGAVGDGVADDYAALQAAFDFVNSVGGGVVEIQDGTYLTSQQLRVYANTRVSMSDNAIIRRNFNTSATGAGLFGVNGTPSNIHFEGGTLDCNGATYQTGSNIFGTIGARNVSFVGVTFLNVPEFHAIDIADSDGVVVERCRFLGFFNHSATRDFSEAIQLDPDLSNGGSDNQNIVVRNSFFGDNPDVPSSLPWPAAMGNHAAADGNYSEQVAFVGNTCEGMTYAVAPMINFRRVLFSNNSLNGCARGIALEFHKTSGGWNSCSDITAQGNGWSNGTGPFAFVFTPAFNTADGNDTHDRIAIISNVVNETGTESGLDMKWCRDLTIAGNSFSATDGAIHMRFCRNVNVSANNVRNSSASGVWVYESGETDFVGSGLTQNITIAANHLENLDFRGIHVNCDAQRTTISGNTVIDANQDAGGTRPAIQSDSGADDTSIIGNTIRFSAAITSLYSITVTSGTGHVVKGNHAPVGATNAYQILAAGTLAEIDGNGSPETVISAAVGSTYRRLDGGAGTAGYSKESGTGNTGWAAK